MIKKNDWVIVQRVTGQEIGKMIGASYRHGYFRCHLESTKKSVYVNENDVIFKIRVKSWKN